jgi:carboxymethylenebutenolidase
VRGDDITIRSSGYGRFSCYLATPRAGALAPAVVLASTVRGVDEDLRTIADEFADNGFIAAAPDLFWRASANSPSRTDQIRAGERDLVDMLAHLRTVPRFSGRAVAMGFCYGGPYAILGPKRLGYAAGISCHGTQMLDFIDELDDLGQRVCLMWGDCDHLAPKPVLDAYRDVPSRMNNVEVHVFPGVRHGYMMPRSQEKFDAAARDFSMARAMAILDALASAR